MGQFLTSGIPSNLLACATCMGDEGDISNKAAGYAIIFMLAMLTLVLGSIIKFMHYLSKREKGAGLTRN